MDYVPGTVLNTTCINLSHPHKNLWRRYYRYSYFAPEETEIKGLAQDYKSGWLQGQESLPAARPWSALLMVTPAAAILPADLSMCLAQTLQWPVHCLRKEAAALLGMRCKMLISSI